MIKKILSLLLIFTGIAVMNSCTKLKEEILDESSVVGLTDKQQAEGVIAPVYAKLEDVFCILPFLLCRRFQQMRLFCLSGVELTGVIMVFMYSCINMRT